MGFNVFVCTEEAGVEWAPPVQVLRAGEETRRESNSKSKQQKHSSLERSTVCITQSRHRRKIKKNINNNNTNLRASRWHGN